MSAEESHSGHAWPPLRAIGLEGAPVPPGRGRTTSPRPTSGRNVPMEEISMNPRPRLTMLAALLLVAGLTLPAGPAMTAAETPALGEVRFEVGCAPEAQAAFNTAMAYYYSFVWHRTTEPLTHALQADPGCGMAHWAQALALLDNPFVWPANLSAQKLDEGELLIGAARTSGLRSQRERDYVDALASFFDKHADTPHKERAQRLERALEAMAAKYADDPNAAILHALVLSANFDPADKAYTNQLRAAAILEPIFRAQPQHPGVAHFLIHSYDYPPIAHKGLDAARRYGAIAPAAAHAQHMPSHVFTRVGAWRESIEANRASAQADARQTWNAMHAYDYMAYAHLQLGEIDAARDVLRLAGEMPITDHFASAYAYAAIPARLALERDAWDEAARLELQPARDAYPWAKYPQAEAVNAFARGLGAAARGDAAAAQAEIERLHRLRQVTEDKKLAYWSEQIAIQADVVRGLAMTRAGELEAGIGVLAAAAAREDASEKHVVTPGPILPAREVLADVLRTHGRAVEARAAYEAVLQKEPNRLRAMKGVAVAAETAGATADAKAMRAQIDAR